MASRNNRDVELVIRAREQATKVIDSVSEAIAELTTAQAGLVQGATKTGTGLSRLGGEFKNLTNEVKGLSALAAVTGHLDKAAAAVGRLESQVESATVDLAKMSDANGKAVASTNGLRASIGATVAALKQQKDTTAAARAEQTNANKELRDAEGFLARIQRQIAKGKGGAAAASFEVFAAGDLAKARQAADVAASVYEKQRAEVAKTETQLRQLKDATRVAGENQLKLATDVGSASSALTNQRQALAKAKDDLAGITQIAGTASRALGGVPLSQQAISDATTRVAADLAKVTDALKDQKKEASTAATAGPAAAAAKGYRDQAQAVNEAQKAWKEARAEANRLATELKNTAEPSRQLQTSFSLAATASAKARAEYLNQASALRDLRGTVQGSFQAFSQNAQQQQNAAAAQRAFAAAALRVAPPVVQAAQAALTFRQALSGLVASFRQAQGGATGFAGALGAVQSGSASSSSLIGRLRGEVLGLATAYIGLQGAIGQIGGVIKSFQGLEAVQNRLGAVFEQDTSKVATEVSFLEQQAARLGITFSVMADEYGKFAIAAKAANFQSDATRKVFLSVAEAGRVNKLSVEQMQGVYMALTQMISKGKIQSEELRRQLGDRLPGAFNIMADALGVTTAELDKMMQKGEVLASQSNLIKFANELDKRFGGQLAKSLDTVTTNLGRFSNEIYQAQLRVANGGFTDALANMLAKLNEFFNSREGRDFFLGLGAALGKVTDGLTIVVQNFDTVKKVIGAVIALKVSSSILGMVQSFSQLTGVTTSSVASLFTWQSTANATSTTVTRLRAALLVAQVGFQNLGAGAIAAVGAVRNLNVMTGALGAAMVASAAKTGLQNAAFGVMRIGATTLVGTIRTVGVAVGALATGFRALWVAVGGWVGIAVTAITFIAGQLLGDWFTAVDNSTKAMDEHQRIVQEVGKAYTDAKGKVDNFGDSVKNVTLSQAVNNLDKMRDAYEGLRKEVTDTALAQIKFQQLRGGSGVFAAQITTLDTLTRSYRDGKITAVEYSKSLEQVFKETHSDSIKLVIKSLQDQIAELKTAENRYRDAATAAKAMGDDSSATDKIIQFFNGTLKTLAGVTDDVSTGLEDSATAATKLQEAVKDVKELIPSMAGEMKRLKDLGKLEDIIGGLTLGKNADEVRKFMAIVAEARKEINDTANKALTSGGLYDKLVVAESGGKKGQKSDTSSAAGILGFTESTWIEFFDKVFSNLKLESPEFKLSQRDNEAFVKPIFEAFTSFNADQLRNANQPVTDQNLSLAHFLGSGDAIRVLIANPKEIAANVVDPKSVAANPKVLGGGKTVQQVIDFAGERIAIPDSAVKSILESADAQQKFAESIKETVDAKRAEANAIKETGDRAGYVAKAVAAAEAEANKNREKGVKLTQEQRVAIEEAAGALFDQKHREDALTESKRLAAEATSNVVGLEQQRKTLMSELQNSLNEGDTEKADTVRGEIEAITAKLKEALPLAMQMAQALGDEKMIATLNKVALGVDTIKVQVTNAKEINESFARGGVGVFTDFAKAIASGSNAIQALGQSFLAFAADFLLQIGQMIIQQAILNALQSSGFGKGVAGFVNGLFGAKHSGGIVGTGGDAKRSLPAAWFANAQRYHGGGIAGLKPNEVPTILQKNEEVLTTQDPRHMFNGGGGAGGGAQQDIKIVNAFDSADMLAKAMETKPGQRVLMNFVRTNATLIKGALG